MPDVLLKKTQLLHEDGSTETAYVPSETNAAKTGWKEKLQITYTVVGIMAL